MFTRKRCFFIFFILLTLLIAGNVCAQKLNMVTTEFCPYVCISDKEDGHEGFVLDIFRAIFEKHGYAVSFEIQPWTRTLKIFNKKGQFDGLLAATKLHPINKDIAVFPETEICRYTHKFYGLKDSRLAGVWKYEGIESLKEISLGGIKGWSYCSLEVTRYVNDPPPGVRVSAMYGENLVRRNMKMLLKKHTDLYVENEFMARHFLHKEKKAGNTLMGKIIPIDKVPVDEGTANSYPVFYKDKNGEKYADMFTRGIKELRAKGEIDTIMAKYGLKDWK
ncbi:substrate-binding periplasmic protein [Desulfonema magnum]|uniref:ABC transporter, periplasmatic binding protein n=1 Tax=Desulfonema magnum TaxID=45655 RepID=A0A975BKP1_9BACT|nr:transporter substrate-binding domain-containing protein [Desulfonema magnum]QTA87171.1 putative ABC transporter, periplasmatic binding protein [Desulfonema magnum]